MITPSFGLTATERVLPKLALDFTTASLDSRVTFTRAGNTATVVNSSGVIASINANLPRFDYNPVTLVCKGLLIEEARTNTQLSSADFSNVAWTLQNTTVTTNALTAPDNTLSADVLTQNSATSFHGLTGTIVVTSGTTYCWSVFAKAKESTFLQLTFGNTSGTFSGVGYANFNLSTGVVSATGGTLVGSGIEAYGNGWYRCSITATATANGATNNWIAIANSGTYTRLASYAGDNASGFYIWGAQIETGAFATSYIPTVASQVTRTADVATMTGTNFSDWYTATTGAAVVWAIPQAATGTRPLIQFDDTTANEIIVLRGNVANPELYIIDGGAPQAQIDAGTIVANTAYKLSGAWNTDSCAAAQNGAAAVTDNTATIPTPTQLRIGSDGTNYASAWVQKILYYPQRLTNAEVQAFSK